jgi:CRISPR-associated protein Cas6
MFWHEETPKEEFQVPDDLVDVLFSLKGRQIPVDHAQALSAALESALPWLADEPDAAVHLIHVAGSQNGWQRPEDLLHISRRTKLVLRLPTARLEDARRLVGQTLDLGGHRVEVGEFTTRPLSTQGTMFARYVVSDASESEDAFLRRVADELSAMDVRVRKALCGKSAVIRTPEGPVHTRSLMLADLSPEEAVRLQRRGLGSGRRMGCGIFIPHKGIEAVKKAGE